MTEYKIIPEIITWIISIYLGLSSIYLFIFSVSSLFYRKKQITESADLKSFLVLIPGYKEDNVIVHTAKQALKQNYPSDLFDVYVIADSFNKSTIQRLNENKINVIEVSFEISSKAKSINKALSSIEKIYDAIIILDADNIMENEFIKKMNYSLSQGHKVIQAHRIAKNQNNTIAVLDAISEEINNSIFRKGHSTLGLSSALIGSGMAFEYHLYKTLIKSIDSFAEDKELELKLFKNHYKVVYYEEAYVYDEKISKAKSFINQRARWVSLQIYYAQRYLLKAIYELFTKFNFELFNKLLQLFLLPRIILLGVFLIGLVLSYFFGTQTLFYFWLVSLIICYVAIIIAIPKRFFNKSIFKAIFYLPYGFLLMLASIIKFRKARKNFNPTPHTKLKLNLK